MELRVPFSYRANALTDIVFDTFQFADGDLLRGKGEGGKRKGDWGLPNSYGGTKEIFHNNNRHVSKCGEAAAPLGCGTLVTLKLRPVFLFETISSSRDFLPSLMESARWGLCKHELIELRTLPSMPELRLLR